MDLTIYIGYDEREDIAAQVCKFSIERRLKHYAQVKFLRSKDIPAFTRPREPHQATDFTYTRFLVPYLCGFKGFSIFCDCDFLFVDDIGTIFQDIDLRDAVSVVQHPQYVPRSSVKMDGVPQAPMLRKNWASLMVFNNEHPHIATLTPEFVNTFPGRSLHQFGWLSDSHIGSLPLEWNCLDQYYHLTKPKAIHYTDGGPWFEKYRNTFYSQQWINEHNIYESTPHRDT